MYRISLCIFLIIGVLASGCAAATLAVGAAALFSEDAKGTTYTWAGKVMSGETGVYDASVTVWAGLVEEDDLFGDDDDDDRFGLDLLDASEQPTSGKYATYNTVTDQEGEFKVDVRWAEDVRYEIVVVSKKAVTYQWVGADHESWHQPEDDSTELQEINIEEP